MKNLGQDKLLNLEIAVPPLPEQKKIAAILSSVDDAIESTRSVIEQLGAVKQAMMAELLTRGLPGRHTRFKQTEIGELPEAWSVGTLAQLIESCDYGLSKALSGFPVGPAVLRMGNLSDGLVVLDDLKYIDADAVPASLFLRRGDVLFNRTNSKDLVGKVGVFLGSPHPVSFASYLLRLRPLQDTTSGEWLGAVMNLGVNQARLREMATPGISQVNINRGIMLSMKVAIPPLAEQVELMNVLSSASERVHSETVATEQLRNLKSALMSVLLTGELRVHPDEDAA
jgi:type I restriction enzyme S subunit